MLGNFLQPNDKILLQKLRGKRSTEALLQAMTATEKYVTTLENVEKARKEVAEAIKQGGTVSSNTSLSLSPSHSLEQAAGRRNHAWLAHLQAAKNLKAVCESTGILKVDLREESLWLEGKAACSFGMPITSETQGSVTPCTILRTSNCFEAYKMFV